MDEIDKEFKKMSERIAESSEAMKVFIIIFISAQLPLACFKINVC